MITLQTFHSRIEAEMVKSLLETENIPTLIRADDEAGMVPSMGLTNGVDLLIQPEDLEKANDLLNAIPFPK
jgi:hypothetical protein